MVKKFTFFFLLGIIGLFTTNLFAQEDATIDPAEIKFWIGEGENEVVFIANWAEPDTALAWGYRFEAENVTLKTIMDDIAAADYRFSYEASGSWLLDMHFNDGFLDLSLVEQMWVSYLINGVSSWDTYDVATVAPGEYVKLGDTHCGTLVDPVNYVYVWEKEVAPVYALGEEAMIDPSEIVYWIGEGENEVVFCVNWNEPNIALAWGYRFSEATVTVENVMDAIAAADGRFSYVGSEGWLSDIVFDDYVNHYALVGPYWMYNVNGAMAWYGYNEQTVVDGDFIKWGDISCATEIAQWTYVWEQPVQPVTVYDAVEEVEAASLSVYPNPATEVLYVNVEKHNFVSVQIYDMAGRNVLTSTESVVNLRGLDAGVYFVTVRTENAAKTTKLVVR